MKPVLHHLGQIHYTYLLQSFTEDWTVTKVTKYFSQSKTNDFYIYICTPTHTRCVIYYAAPSRLWYKACRAACILKQRQQSRTRWATATGFLVSNTVLILLSKTSFWEGEKFLSASQCGQAPKFLQHHTLPPQHSCYEVVSQSPETPWQEPWASCSRTAKSTEWEDDLVSWHILFQDNSNRNIRVGTTPNTDSIWKASLWFWITAEKN